MPGGNGRLYVVTIRRTIAEKQCGFVLRPTYLWSQPDLLK
jgi:hypothetical protein